MQKSAYEFKIKPGWMPFGLLRCLYTLASFFKVS